MAKDERMEHGWDALAQQKTYWAHGKDNSGKDHDYGATNAEDAHKGLEKEIAEANEEDDE